MTTSFQKPFVSATAGVLLAVTSLFGSTPQEEAFLKVWNVHAQTPVDHHAVIEVCQSVMNKASTLGEFLPVVKTLAAWHLLAMDKQQDAVRIFESALTTDKMAPVLARYADTMARRWLSRIDLMQVERALKVHYADNVEFPSSLAPLFALPPGRAPAKVDRFNEPWVYSTVEFSKLTGLKNQKYTLACKAIGAKLSQMKRFPFTSYGQKKAAILSRRSGTPIMVDFEVLTEAGVQRGSASENGSINGIRFLKLDSDGRFAVMIENEGDFWVVATRKR